MLRLLLLEERDVPEEIPNVTISVITNLPLDFTSLGRGKLSCVFPIRQSTSKLKQEINETCVFHS